MNKMIQVHAERPKGDALKKLTSDYVEIVLGHRLSNGILNRAFVYVHEDIPDWKCGAIYLDRKQSCVICNGLGGTLASIEWDGVEAYCEYGYVFKVGRQDVNRFELEITVDESFWEEETIAEDVQILPRYERLKKEDPLQGKLL